MFERHIKGIKVISKLILNKNLNDLCEFWWKHLDKYDAHQKRHLSSNNNIK